MSDSRFIINEVRRSLGNVPIASVENLIASSPTLQSAIANGDTFITPQQVQKILREVQQSQAKNVDAPTLLQTIENIRNNPFFVTPNEAQQAEAVEDFEDLALFDTTLLSSIDGELFVDPDTGAFIEAPTPNVRGVGVEKSAEGTIGALDADDVNNMLLILEDEIRLEYEARGEEHSLETITEDGKMGVFGLTIDDLVAAGIVSQNAIDSYNEIPEEERIDYANLALTLGLITAARYEKTSELVRKGLEYYTMSSRDFWLNKAIGPKNFLLLRQAQLLIAQRAILKDYKLLARTIFEIARQRSADFNRLAATVGSYLVLARMYGRNAIAAYGFVSNLRNQVGRAASEVFKRVNKAIQSKEKGATSAKQLDEKAKAIPDPPPPSPKPARRSRFFPNIKQQKTNESLVKVPETQGFYDPNRVYPRVDAMGEPDLNRLARREKIQDTIVGHKEQDRTLDIPVARNAAPRKWSQPKSPYNARYPHNHVYESESGHVVEFDDTPDNERVHIYHREGTFVEIDRNGTWTQKIIGDAYQIYERDGNIYIAGRANVTIDGNCNVYVKNNVNLQVDGNLTADIHKNMVFNVAKNLDITAGGEVNIKSKKSMNLQSTDASINVRAKNTLSVSGSNTHVRAERVLRLSGELSASLAAPKGAALLLAGAAPVTINGVGLNMLPAPLPVPAAALARQHAASDAGQARSGAPPKEKNPSEPKFPPLILESRVDDWSEALSTLSENPNENKNEIKVLKKKAIKEGLITKEDLNRPLTKGASDIQAPPPAAPPKIASCAAIQGATSFGPTYSLSRNVTLGGLKGTDRLTQQHGLTKQDIVCNLKQLAENVIEPIYDLFGKNQIIITSCFRWPGYNTGSFKPASGISFHEQGLAVDLCFCNKPFSLYYDYAVQIKQALQYDKLLLEYRLGTVNGITTYKPWIHLQWQQPAINLANGRKGGPARREVFTMKNDQRIGGVNELINLLPNVNFTY